MNEIIEEFVQAVTVDGKPDEEKIRELFPQYAEQYQEHVKDLFEEAFFGSTKRTRTQY
jgi:hypothetical protein